MLDKGAILAIRRLALDATSVPDSPASEIAGELPSSHLELFLLARLQERKGKVGHGPNRKA